ncbi:MAG: ABC transporter substrate-binding protein [Oscillospiraceae bacterium]
MTVLLMILLSAAALSACGNDDDGSGYTFNATIENNPRNLDPQLAEDRESVYIIKNIFGGLMETDENGRTVCGTAESYRVSDDGLTYTFTLRDGLEWYGIASEEKISLTAYDYVYAFKRIYTKSTASPYTDMFSCIKNSLSYYNGMCPESSFGVYAENEKTVVFELERQECDFLKMLTYSPAMPCNEELFLSTQGRYGLSAKSTFSCGAFYVSEWNYDPYWHDNYIILSKLSANSLPDYRTYPDEVRIGITDDTKEYADRNSVEIDVYVSDNVKDIDRDSTWTEYTADIVYLSYSPDFSVYSSDNGRAALAKVISHESLADELSDNCTLAYRIIPEDVTVFNTKLRDIFADSPVELSEFGLAKAMWQDFCRGISNSDINSSSILVSDDIACENIPSSITSCWERELDFYCTPDFKEKSEYISAAQRGEYDMIISSASANNNNAAYLLENIAGSALNSSDKAKLLSDMEQSGAFDRKKAAVDAAERELISKAYVIPLYYQSEYVVMSEDTEDIFYDPFSKALYFKYAKHY